MFALSLMGALVASIFFAGRLEQQSGQNMFFACQAREAAEAGLADARATLDAGALEALPAGGMPLQLGNSAVGEGVTAVSSVARLTSRVFLIRSQGTRHDASGGALATRSLGLLVRLVEAAEPGDSTAGSAREVVPLDERAWIRLY
jgi:hypothetical protein